MKTFHLCMAIFVFICLLLVCTGLYAQEDEKTDSKYKHREQKLYIDIPLTIGEIALINVIGNVNWRLWGADSETAFITTESMRQNFNPNEWLNWGFEIGRGRDTFLVNQFFHPYAGGVYFAAARANNLNFYWSILSPVLGSFTWEALCEIDSPAASDFINTAFSGIAIGEIMHRLFLEAYKGGLARKAGSFIVSPTDWFTTVIRRYGPEKGPSKIRDSSLAFGFSWINALFFDDNEKTATWSTASVFVEHGLVYGDPFTAHSKTPFDQFEYAISLMATVPLIYNFTLIIDGYLASWLLADDDVNQTSNGLTLHFDVFVIDKGAIIELNNGRENMTFNANSLDYSLKWCRIMNNSLKFSMKTHLGFSPWAVADYNGGINRDDYNLYSLGGNIKLFMELRQMKEKSEVKNGHVLSLCLCFYDVWDMPKTPVFSGFDVNTLFLFSKLAYSFPLTERLSLYAADTFMLLHCRLTNDAGLELPNITRLYNSAQLGVKLTF